MIARWPSLLAVSGVLMTELPAAFHLTWGSLPGSTLCRADTANGEGGMEHPETETLLECPRGWKQKSPCAPSSLSPFSPQPSSFTNSRKPPFIPEPWAPMQLSEDKCEQPSWLRGSGRGDSDDPLDEHCFILLPLAEVTAESFV